MKGQNKGDTHTPPTWDEIVRLLGAMAVIAFGTALMGGLTAGEIWLTQRWGYSTPSMGIYVVLMGFMLVGMVVFSQGAIMNYNSMRGVNDCYKCRMEYAFSPGVRQSIVIIQKKIVPTKEIPWWSWDDVLAVGVCLWVIPFATMLMTFLSLDHVI